MPYIHVVFTLPAEIAAIAFCNRGIVFDILFRTAAETLRIIAEDSHLAMPAGTRDGVLCLAERVPPACHSDVGVVHKIGTLGR